MDLDNSEHDSADLASLFDLSPEGFPWRGSRPHEIETRRAEMSDLLIFDILLSSGGLRQPDSLWPPANVASLLRLLDAIYYESTYDALKKDCLVYFLLKWHEDGREEGFKEERCIPPQFAMLSDAYWHLDSGINVPRAISLLSDVRLNRDYTSKIVQAISLSPHSSPLILQYLRTAKPLLTEPDDIDIYALAIAESNLAEAWSFQRTFPEDGATRKRLIHKILEYSLSPSPRLQHLVQLLSLPLSPYEQSLLHDYALSPPPSIPRASIPSLHDLVCVRLIHAGKYADAIKLERQLSGSGEAAERRRKMVDGLMAVLPAIERLAIEEELGALGKRRKNTKLLQSESPVDLSMSWEEIEPVDRPAAAPASKPFVLGRPARGQRFSDTSALPALPNGIESFTVSGRNLFTPAASPVRNAPRAPVQMPLIVSQPNAKAPAASQAPFGLSSPVNGLQSRQNATALPSLFAPTTSATANHTAHPLFIHNDKNGLAAAPPARENLSPPPVVTAASDIKEGDNIDILGEGTDEEPPERAPSSAPAEFSRSVFVNNRGSHSVVKVAPQVPPGAFPEEDDLEAAHTPPSPSSFPPPAKSRRTYGTSARRGEPPALKTAGRFYDEESGLQDAEPEQDEVPPLPDVSPVKRPVRRRRGERADSMEAEEKDVRPRRSTRLSIASSSPEPVSPQKKVVRKTRAAATTAVKATTRRKR